MFCTHCGASNKDDATLCINCHEPLRDNPAEEKLSRLRASKDASPLSKINFLQPLFDFSFHQSVTTRMVKFLYLLFILSAALLAFSFIIVGFGTSILFGILTLLIGAPVVFFLMVISSRVFLETILLVFRVADQVSGKGTVKVKEKPESRDGIQWNV